jgi:hypothetical protein
MLSEVRREVGPRPPVLSTALVLTLYWLARFLLSGLLPPLGGLDLSPILAFTVLNVLQGGAAALPAEMAKGKAVRQQPFQALKKGRKSE